jgi:quinoprotein glucose dehydrogenase
MKRQAWLVASFVIACLLASRAQTRPPVDLSAVASAKADWLYYGGDPGGTKYSPLDDINTSNVQRLQIAWQWKHWDTPPAPGFFESTPLMIDGALYVTTPYNNVAAVDADTGQERWRFDGKAEELGPLLSASGWKLRGTAFWRDGGRLRMFLNSRHRLFSIDAQTGKPVPSFGNSGAVSLSDGLPRISDITHATQSSPPIVYRNLVIVGSQVPDRVQLPDPVGYVQAFDSRTGKRVWTFSVIPQSA